MLDHTNFHNIFPTDGSKAYDSAGVQTIDRFRRAFDGTLFIDRVIEALKIGERSLYPPKGDHGLRSLYKLVCEAPVATHHKLSILYYLLLDYDAARSGPSASRLAETFVDGSGVPKKYHIMMLGLWYMDHMQFESAVERLAHPSLPAEFADEILAALIKHAPSLRTPRDGDANAHSTPPKPNKKSPTTTPILTKDFSLALAYYHTTHPQLRHSKTHALLVAALARTSVPEAFFFVRQQPENRRQALFGTLVSTVLVDPGVRAVATASGGGGSAAPSAGGVVVGGAGSGGGSVSRQRQLVGLPMDAMEERWFREYLVEGDGRDVKGAARQLLVLRAMVTGRYRGSAGAGAQHGITAAA